jgi:hydroxypyruvate reductase
LRRKVSRVCLISGGEVTVTVRNGGIGGRNQQFALACADKISGHDITVLSAGTDGIDGNSPAAGAVVDGSTLHRITDCAGRLEACLALRDCEEPALNTSQAPDGISQQVLAAFNAYPLFDALGDAIMTGPTGNNLRDLRILLAY